ncbi:MAG: 3',5'-cyclic-nucleotide phosphodiesterase [Pirellulaceae bacterium]
MKIKVVSSSVDQERYQYGATYVLNDRIAFDAGALGFSSLSQQRRIQHVVLSHVHMDHICSLPQYLDNVYEVGPTCPRIYGSDHVLQSLQQSLFNDRVWPDLSRLSKDESPFVRFIPLQPDQPIVLEGLTITPIELDHVIPCFGFLIEDHRSAIALVSDTGPTERVWERARQQANLQAVFVESAFPNALAWLAEQSKHLTPRMLLDEYRKLGKEMTVITIHIKPAHYENVVCELKQLGLPKLIIAEPNAEYSF